MDLSEIAVAFRNCNAETNKLSFKDYRHILAEKGIDTVSGAVVNDANNYILYDCERLLTKSLINVICSDLLLTKGLFNWAFVSSYYSSFYSIQALNRFQLNFSAFELKCELVNYAAKQVKLTKCATSSGSHDEQFHKFFNENVAHYRKSKVDREWNIGLGNFEDLGGYGTEPRLRNAINYYLSKKDDFYYEFSLGAGDFNRIIRDNKLSPFTEREAVSIPPNFARRAFKLAISRIRVQAYVLNYIANYNREYKTYFDRNMSLRVAGLRQRYDFTSPWLVTYLERWLKYEQLPIEEV